jgi:hypothetical protein
VLMAFAEQLRMPIFGACLRRLSSACRPMQPRFRPGQSGFRSTEEPLLGGRYHRVIEGDP